LLQKGLAFPGHLNESQKYTGVPNESAAPFGVRRDFVVTPSWELIPVNTTEEKPTKSPRPSYEPADLVWGAAGVAQVLGLTERQAFFMLEKKKIPAKKVGGRWCVSRSRLLEACGA
jgi:hypothetical protein